MNFKVMNKLFISIKSYILEGTSFNQETPLSAKNIINNIKAAKEKVANNNFQLLLRLLRS